MRPLSTLLLSSLLVLLSPSFVAAQCSESSQCGASNPCCSSSGYCGSTSDYCSAAGCNPLGSFTPSSCSPMSACKDVSLDLRNLKASNLPYVPIKQYDSTSSNPPPFTLDVGKVSRDTTGLTLVLDETVASTGTLLSSTSYMLYGSASATIKHANKGGVVAAFILMSPTKDEVDIFELTTSKAQEVQTNFFWKGLTSGTFYNGATISSSKLPSATFTTNAFHKYTLTWTPTTLTWSIDDKVVRVVNRSSRKVSSSKKRGPSTPLLDDRSTTSSSSSSPYYEFPSTPSRVQLSVWCAGCPQNAPGTQAWSGGKIDFSKTPAQGGNKGQSFSMTVQNLDIKCQTPSRLRMFNQWQFSDEENVLYRQPKVVGKA